MSHVAVTWGHMSHVVVTWGHVGSHGVTRGSHGRRMGSNGRRTEQRAARGHVGSHGVTRVTWRSHGRHTGVTWGHVGVARVSHGRHAGRRTEQRAARGGSTSTFRRGRATAAIRDGLAART
eukprot:1426008-Prymnesium_polylepis.1